ncbi:hypothetical protein BGX29_009089 [Mortierella sp. GBA35]|nr:hypothetical protein BGX29_009089 [Mortierella sp. GBA35]
MFNALQGTGSYGLNAKHSDVGNHASTALSCVFAISSLFAGALFNIFGHRLLLIVGGMTYCLYVGSFLAYHYISSIAFVVVASCLLGVGAGWLWCAQGAIMMGYPEEGDKGKYFAIFWAIFNCGGVIGNVIPLVLQWNDPEAGGASTGAYATYMVLMTIGAFLSLLLLPTSKVFRRDGSNVVRVRYSSPTSELFSVFKLFLDWRMLCLIPMFFTSNWVYTYQFNAVNAFNLREWSRPKRARYGLILLTILLAGTWTGGFLFQRTFGPRNNNAVLDEKGQLVKNPADFRRIDLVQNTGDFIGPFFLYLAYGVTDSMYQGFSYWLMGALTNDTNQAARFAGFYKFVQNLGGVLAPVVQTSIIGNGPWSGYNATHAITRGMGEFLVCVVLGAVPVAFRAVKEHTIEEGDDIIELGDKQELYDKN